MLPRFKLLFMNMNCVWFMYIKLLSSRPQVAGCSPMPTKDDSSDSRNHPPILVTHLTLADKAGPPLLPISESPNPSNYNTAPRLPHPLQQLHKTWFTCFNYWGSLTNGVEAAYGTCS